METRSIQPDIRHLLAAFRDGLLQSLGENLVALYVGGSLLTDDFAPASSDIDFLAMVSAPLPPSQVERLAALHRHLAALSVWGSRLEGEYAVHADLRPWGIDGSGPAIEPGGILQVIPLTDVTAENLLALRDRGLSLHGPPPHMIIPPVDHAVFQAALREYLVDLLQRPDAVSSSAQLADWLLNSARCLYGLQVIRPCTKRESAEWLAARMPDLAPALELALSLRSGTPVEDDGILHRAMEMLRETVDAGPCDDL